MVPCDSSLVEFRARDCNPAVTLGLFKLFPKFRDLPKYELSAILQQPFNFDLVVDNILDSHTQLSTVNKIRQEYTSTQIFFKDIENFVNS